jgi:phage/plasmid-like protein (TIGR03299 family)
MAHALTTRSNGFVEFAYAQADGEAWHGLGQSVATGATQAEWTVAAGMDWRVQRGLVRYNTDREGSQAIVPGQHVLFRSDTSAALGIVSDGYKVVQPAECLDFFADIARANGVELSAAGTLNGGRRFWATAKIGEASPVSIADKIGGYLLVATSADGSLATEVRLTTVRVVCANTLAMARVQGQAAVRVTHRSTFDADAIKADLGINQAAWAAFRHSMVRLANKAVLPDQAEQFIAGLFAKSQAQASLDNARLSRGYASVLNLFNGAALGSELDGVQGTAYGLLQAVTEHVDHHARATSVDNRFSSAQWGPGSDMKNEALTQLLALA